MLKFVNEAEVAKGCETHHHLTLPFRFFFIVHSYCREAATCAPILIEKGLSARPKTMQCTQSVLFTLIEIEAAETIVVSAPLSKFIFLISSHPELSSHLHDTLSMFGKYQCSKSTWYPCLYSAVFYSVQ